MNFTLQEERATETSILILKQFSIWYFHSCPIKCKKLRDQDSFQGMILTRVKSVKIYILK